MIDKKEPIYVVNRFGEEFDFERITQDMDSNIREYLHCELAPCEPQFFYDMYCILHKKIKREEFWLEEGL